MSWRLFIPILIYFQETHLSSEKIHLLSPNYLDYKTCTIITSMNKTITRIFQWVIYTRQQHQLLPIIILTRELCMLVANKWLNLSVLKHPITIHRVELEDSCSFKLKQGWVVRLISRKLIRNLWSCLRRMYKSIISRLWMILGIRLAVLVVKPQICPHYRSSQQWRELYSIMGH